MRVWALGLAATLMLLSGSATADEDGPYDGLDNSPLFIAGIVLDFTAFGAGLPVIVEVAHNGRSGFFERPELVVPGAIAAASVLVGIPLTIAGAVQCPPEAPATEPRVQTSPVETSPVETSPVETSMVLGPGRAALIVRF